MPTHDGAGAEPSIDEPGGAARLTIDGRAVRIAFLSYSTGEFDARTLRMARSAIRAGCEVTVYARWHPGLLPIEQRDGYRLVRMAWDWRQAVPGIRGRVRRRILAAMARAGAETVAAAETPSEVVRGDAAAASTRQGSIVRRAAGWARDSGWRVRRASPLEGWHWWVRVREFPLRPLGWAVGLDGIAEPADIWHGMWVGSLPALARLRARHGGRAIYDSRDVFMRSRDFARLGRPGRSFLEWLERHWAGQIDRVLTVNEAYATLLERDLRVPRPAVVMNCPEIWTPPSPKPDLIREALDIPTETAVALYQGRLSPERGIEQAVEAILGVPNAVLVLLGFGIMQEDLARQASQAPYAGRIYVLPPVTPDELLLWSASADVLVMAIQPTTTNHRYTTPQKLFEALAAGVPVVASDLPGMAEIVRSTGAGILCDPTSAASIADAIRRIVTAPPPEREAMRARALRAAHDRYNWESQVETLLGLYRELLAGDIKRARPVG